MKKLKATLTADFNDDDLDILAQVMDIHKAGFALTNDFIHMMSEDELIQELHDKDVLIVSYENITARVIANCPNLKLIASIRGGPEETLDVEAALAAGVPVIRTVGRTQRPVSEHTAMLMLAMARPIVASANILRSKLWSPAVMKTDDGQARLNRLYETSTELYGKQLGLIGLGNIAEAVARIALAFGMRVDAFDPYCSSERAGDLGVSLVDLETLLRTADYVSIHARVSPETVGIIGRAQLQLMKPTAALINTARASLVDTAALIEALEKNWIRAAAVDVFDIEPLPNAHPYHSIPEEKLLMTTHLAGFSKERGTYHSRFLRASLMEYLEGSVPDGIFHREVFDSSRFNDRGAELFGIFGKQAL